jgi:hypothetical protein
MRFRIAHSDSLKTDRHDISEILFGWLLHYLAMNVKQVV